MNRSKATTISIITLLILSLSFTIVSAQLQYEGGKVSPITIGSNGSETITESSLGITYVIQGTPGAAGKLKTFLEDKGYTVAGTGNTDRRVCRIRNCGSPGEDSSPARAATRPSDVPDR